MIDTFERVYCVNLERRPEKWQQFIEGLPRDWPFKQPERYNAISGKHVSPPSWWTAGRGAWGCYKSHMNLIELCLNEGVESVLLLEDDAVFPEDFTEKCKQFLNKVPNNWEMLYLGGQLLKARQHSTTPVNDEVFIPHNVNRTHAFALKGGMLNTIYRHINEATTWMRGHHIDHHLGRLHQRKQHRIYVPKEWLVGQREGKSDISFKHFNNDRFWPSPSSLSGGHKDVPFVAILGTHSSGSSCIAGMVHILGVHLGNNLTGYYSQKNKGNGGFEAAGLAHLCEKLLPFPEVGINVKPGQIWKELNAWVQDRRREAIKLNTLAGGKYPQLCRMGDQLLNTTHGKLKVIMCERPLHESIESIQRRDRGRHCAKKLRAHQAWLAQGKSEMKYKLKPEQYLEVHYHDVLDDPVKELRRIGEFLEIEVTEGMVDRTLQHVNPQFSRHSKRVTA